MKVEKKQIEPLVMQAVFTLTPEDYAKEEAKGLQDCKRNAAIKGFRPGMAPKSLIQKLYGERVLVDAVNHTLSKALDDFISSEQLNVIGEPKMNGNDSIEWKSGNDFTFSFDMAYTEPVDITVSKDDKLTSYKVEALDNEIEDGKKNMLARIGEMQEVGTSQEEDYLKVDFKNDSHTAEDVSVSVRSVDGPARDKFIGVKAGDKFEIDVNEAFTNETDRASMLKLKKEELEGIDPKFNVEIINVRRFVPAEESQESYDKLFGPDKVHSAQEFTDAIKENIEKSYEAEAEQKLNSDIREHFLEKADIQLPDAFLKDWLLRANEGKFTAEEIEKDYPAFAKDFRWSMIRDFLMEKYDLKVSNEEIHQAAEDYAAYQYSAYGLGNVPHEILHDAAQRMLSDNNQRRHIIDSVGDSKVFQALKNDITVSTKKITSDKFVKLLSEK